jgi:hypothetical protein
MWVLLFLLSLLVRLRDRRRMALVAGTFVLASGAVCEAFMAAWLNVFLAVGLTQPARIGLALLALVIGAFNVKDFLSPGRGATLAASARDAADTLPEVEREQGGGARMVLNRAHHDIRTHTSC